MKGNINFTSNIDFIDKEYYVDLNPRNYLFDTRIDTTDREHDIMLPSKCRIVREVSLQIPDGMKAELPQSQKFSMPNATMECIFSRKGNKVILKRVIEITNTLIKRTDMPLWNRTLKQLNDACNEQITLK